MDAVVDVSRGQSFLKLLGDAQRLLELVELDVGNGTEKETVLAEFEGVLVESTELGEFCRTALAGGAAVTI